jgi:hypothetical protein
MLRMRTFAYLLILVGACSSEPGGGETRLYSPCNGESGACGLATRMSGADGDGCLCTYYCKVDGDCPEPATGTAVAVCRSFGDYSINGQTGDCHLPCSAATKCPDGMFCSGGSCWAQIGK